jgi:hypothetical protein
MIFLNLSNEGIHLPTDHEQLLTDSYIFSIRNNPSVPFGATVILVPATEHGYFVAS